MSILNLFRKDKICTFYPNTACSGSGPAICEFLKYKEEIESSTEAKVIMLYNYSFFGFERIVYKIIRVDN